jgi:hypothetical protein
VKLKPVSLACDPELERDQSGVRRCEATSLEVERSEVGFEIDMEPLTTGSASLGHSDLYELGSDSLPGDPRAYDRVQDEGVDATIPRHIDEADELVVILGADPTEAVPLHWPFQSSSRFRWLNASAWSAFTSALLKSPRHS